MRNTIASRGPTYGRGGPAADCRAPLRNALRSASVVAAFLLASAVGVPKANAESSATQNAAACTSYGNWISLKTGQPLDRGQLFGDLVAKNAVVLLGESHTDVDHHLWELHTVAALHGRGANLVLGFEAFPRRVQAVLDDWVAGKLTDEQFLKSSEWRQVWGYDAAFYMPLFQFARLNRIPMKALNVERSLVAKVGQQGWEAVPVAEREGVSDPAPASQAYQRDLARVYVFKKSMSPEALQQLPNTQASQPPEPDEAALTAAVGEPEFRRFAQAQLTWDRAMAEGLVNAKREFPTATIVGIMGSGHVEDGNGVPHQLKDLGITELETLIPVTAKEACQLVGTAYADAVFTLQRSEGPPPDRPRLGVVLGIGDGAPKVGRVVGNSVAEAAGVKTGDLVVRAAGVEMRTPDDLVDVVGRQAPGTWLPLSVKRDGQEIDLIAKFPPRPKQDG